MNQFDFEAEPPKLSYLQEFYKNHRELIAKILVAVFFLMFFFYLIFLTPPDDFPRDHVVHINEGLSLNEIADVLDSERIIRYPFLFKVVTFLTNNQRDIVSGDYFFNNDLNLFSLLGRLVKGEYGLSAVSVTFPEGVTVKQIGQILKLRFPDFKEEEFLGLATSREGFLFPDTYKFLPNVGPRQVIFEMETNFENKVAPLQSSIEESNFTLEEVIAFASILEEEARTTESRKMISGVLRNRLEIDMPLQVDAVFPYILGKNTFELTLVDLSYDSPYNTYKYKGLPPGAISNPGLSSIRAVLEPTPNDYFYYLSDLNGRMHYAKTFEEHKRNKALYLR